ncbi:MAG: hypothetical protein ABIP48_20340 [Planctomycetota bacterium]
MSEPEQSNALDALRRLTLDQVENRLAEIDGERASLSLLRRSIVARERAQRRTQERSVSRMGGRDE